MFLPTRRYGTLNASPNVLTQSNPILSYIHKHYILSKSNFTSNTYVVRFLAFYVYLFLRMLPIYPVCSGRWISLKLHTPLISTPECCHRYNRTMILCIMIYLYQRPHTKWKKFQVLASPRRKGIASFPLSSYFPMIPTLWKTTQSSPWPTYQYLPQPLPYLVYMSRYHLICSNPPPVIFNTLNLLSLSPH